MQNSKSNSVWERGHGPSDYEPDLKTGHPRPPRVNADAGVQVVSQQIMDRSSTRATDVSAPPNGSIPLRLHLNEPWTQEGDALSVYPDPTALQHAVAEWHEVPPRCELLTVGCDHAIDTVIRAFGGPVVVLDPDFPRYVDWVNNSGQQLVKVPVPPDGTCFPADELMAAAKNARMIILAKRGNPTGYDVPDGFIVDLHNANRDLIIVLDDCYGPLVGVTHHGWAAKTPNVIAVWSFSKVGFPGLRVGGIVATSEMIATMKRFVSPFALSGPSIATALDLLQDPTFSMKAKACIDRQIAARDYLAAEFRQRGVEIANPAGNWIMARIGPAAPKFADELKRRGILVQAPTHPALAGWLRVSTPNLRAVTAFLQAFDEVLAGAVAAEGGLFRLRRDYCEPNGWMNAPFVFRVASKCYPIDHIAITLPDADRHRFFTEQLVLSGAEIVEGPGVWPDEFCDDLPIVDPDLSMQFSTVKLPGGLLVAAAPANAGDQIDRWRHKRGSDAVHHIAILADDIDGVAADLAADGWTPMTETPVSDGELAQWFLRNSAGQIIEIISRPIGGDATFTCGNIAALRQAEAQK